MTTHQNATGSASVTFAAGARLRRAPVGIAALGVIPAVIAWELTARAAGWGSPLAIVAGVVVWAPFVVVAVVMERRLRRLQPRFVVDDDGLGLIQAGRRRTVRWADLEAVGVERQLMNNPVSGAKPTRHLVGWAVPGSEPLRLTATAEASRRDPAGGYRLVDLGWFGGEEALIEAVRAKAGSRWRD